MNGMITYTYDNAGRRTGMNLSNGTDSFAQANYTYDTRGRIATVGNNTDTLTYTYIPSTLEMLPEMSIYMLAWLLVLAYHCFMLILPFTLKNFVQTAKEKQKRFLYWLYGISLPGILLSFAYILFCFSGGDWGEYNCGGTFVWLRQLPLSGYIPIIYFVTITALYQYKYSKGKK